MRELDAARKKLEPTLNIATTTLRHAGETAAASHGIRRSRQAEGRFAVAGGAPAEPSSQAGMGLGGFRKVVGLAGLAAEAQTPMMVADKTKLAATAFATVVQFRHRAPPVWRLAARLSEAVGDHNDLMRRLMRRYG
jgi:hypothetical protein